MGDEILRDMRHAGSLPKFSGLDKDWLEYELKAESWMLMIPMAPGDRTMEELLNTAVAWPGVIDMAPATPSAQAASRTMFFGLVQSLQGKASKLARQCPRGNGFEFVEVVQVEV